MYVNVPLALAPVAKIEFVFTATICPQALRVLQVAFNFGFSSAQITPDVKIQRVYIVILQA